VNPRCFGVALLLVCAPALAQEPPPATQPEAPAVYDKDRAHAYAGFGLVAASSSASALLVPDQDAEGGGLLARGAAHSAKVNPSLDIGFTGQVALMSRTFDGTDEEVGDALVELDGGIRVAELFYFTLGYTTQTTAYETPDLATTYTVVPVGAGLYRTTESGYYLLQVRVGGGRLSNDQNDDTEGVTYGGVRAVLQQGFGSKLQFLLGLGLDRYDLGDYENDDFVRLEFGLGFGL
jgi:hypothetical protein